MRDDGVRMYPEILARHGGLPRCYTYPLERWKDESGFWWKPRMLLLSQSFSSCVAINDPNQRPNRTPSSSSRHAMQLLAFREVARMTRTRMRCRLLCSQDVAAYRQILIVVAPRKRQESEEAVPVSAQG